MTSQLDMFGAERAERTDNKKPKPLECTEIRISETSNSENMATLLEETGEYRVLRRLKKQSVTDARRSGFSRLAVIVDTETTGLKKAEDEVIEIGAIAFSYSDDGQVGDLVGIFGAFQRPSRQIPPEIVKLTGITDEMVEGKSIPLQDLETFLKPADLIIAHNAAFDRPFCERLTTAFSSKAWACSNSEIDWRNRGFEGSKLGYLLNQSGFFHDGHRAVDDCYALFEILKQEPIDLDTPFKELLCASRKERVRIWAEQSPFDKKDVLKARGYRWSGGEDQQPKAWWTEVEIEHFDEELNFLQVEIYGRTDIKLTKRNLTAVNRFKN